MADYKTAEYEFTTEDVKEVIPALVKAVDRLSAFERRNTSEVDFNGMRKLLKDDLIPSLRQALQAIGAAVAGLYGDVADLEEEGVGGGGSGASGALGIDELERIFLFAQSVEQFVKATLEGRAQLPAEIVTVLEEMASEADWVQTRTQEAGEAAEDDDEEEDGEDGEGEDKPEGTEQAPAAPGTESSGDGSSSNG